MRSTFLVPFFGLILLLGSCGGSGGGGDGGTGDATAPTINAPASVTLTGTFDPAGIADPVIKVDGETAIITGDTWTHTVAVTGSPQAFNCSIYDDAALLHTQSLTLTY